MGLKDAMLDWLAEDVHRKFTIFKALVKMWLEAKGISQDRQYMYIMQLLGRKGIFLWESFPLLLKTTVARNRLTTYG